MVLETPLLKVSRPVAACAKCRSAKIKCDGKLPACSACEKAGKQAECASSNDNFARGKERSYVSTLETRIERLERRLNEVRLRKSSVISLPDQDQASITPTTSTMVQVNGKAARRKEARDIDDLVSDFGYLTVSAAARDFFGFTSAMSYARLILSACSKDQLPLGMTTPLPPRHLATYTIQHYLDNVYTMMPFFDESSLYYSIDAVYKFDTDGYSSATDFDHWCVRMVLAIANGYLSEQRGDQHYMEGVGHASAALKVAEQVLRPGAVSSVQALLFLSEYALVDPHHFDSWSLIGAASRAMVDLGLHQDPQKGASMALTKSKLDLRRRVFYCVYMLDRSTSIVQTRAFSFSDDSTKVSMPSGPSPAVQKQGWLKGFERANDMIRLRKLQSTWYTDLFQSGREPWSEPYSYIWKTCHDMAAWFSSISPDTPARIRSYLELELLYSYIYLLAPSPRVPVIAPYAQHLIFEHCISYATLMSRLMTDRASPVTFYDAMRVYMTGRQFLDVLNTSQERLLSGLIPDPPCVPADSLPSPPMPMPVSPPDAHANALRTINCLKQLTECLGQFGLRWGYMSWRDNFAKVSEPTMTALNQRLWELQDLSPAFSGGARRMSEWQHTSSTGSVPTMDNLSRQSSYQTQRPGFSSNPGSSSNLSPSPMYVAQAYPSPEAPVFTRTQYEYGVQQNQRPTIADFQQSQVGSNPQFFGWHESFGLDYLQAQGGAQEDESVPPA